MATGGNLLRLGLVVSGDGVKGVLLDCSGNPAVLQEQFSWTLQDGKKPAAFRIMSDHVRNYLLEQGVKRVAIKASGAGRNMTLSHLHSAELRGVVIAAVAEAGVDVVLLQKAVLSRTYGERTTDEYLGDDDFWDERIDGEVKKTYREAAFMALADEDA